MPPLIQPLPSGPVDVIGDVHGEIEALESLLSHLGYDPRGRHPDDRKLVFLGDLVDRGPDSPAVVRLVRTAMEEGGAQCVLGNHELNLLRNERKHGNAWFFGEEEPMGARLKGRFRSVKVESQTERDEMLRFFGLLPVALESEGLRVVHACWDDTAIDTARQADRAAFLAAPNPETWEDEPREKKLEDMKERLGDQTAGPPHFDTDLAKFQLRKQLASAANVLLSGPEQVISSRRPFFAGGQWRFLERRRWWEKYTGTPVIVGHYWRKRRPTGRAGAMPDVDPEFFWGAGYVYCNDFSVGRRFVERAQGILGAFMGSLGAVRYPEWQLVFDDGESIGIKAPNAHRVSAE